MTTIARPDDGVFRLNSRDFATLDCDSDPCFRATLTLAVPRVDLHRSMRVTVTGLCVEGFRVDHASYSDIGPNTWLIPRGMATAVRVDLFQHPLVTPYTDDDDGWPDGAYEQWGGLG